LAKEVHVSYGYNFPPIPSGEGEPKLHGLPRAEADDMDLPGDQKPEEQNWATGDDFPFDDESRGGGVGGSGTKEETGVFLDEDPGATDADFGSGC
jgi:hypothetical protein